MKGPICEIDVENLAHLQKDTHLEILEPHLHKFMGLPSRFDSF